METISSRRNAIVQTFRELARARRRDDRRVLLDGAHLLEEARAAGWPISVAALSGTLLDSDNRWRKLAVRLEAEGARVLRVTDPVASSITPVRTPSGVVAIAERPQVGLEHAFQRSPQFVIVAIDVQDPGNVGAIVRAAEAGGATGLITCGSSADPFGWKALRGAMGSAFRLPLVPRQSVDAAIALARSKGLRVVATAPRADRLLYEADLRARVAVLVGSEGAGLAPDVVAKADLSLSIPMNPPVESLNVAVTTALVVYEAFRQRSVEQR